MGSLAQYLLFAVFILLGKAMQQMAFQSVAFTDAEYQQIECH
jgi:hypothetical protein